MEPLIESDFWRAVVKIGGIVGAFVGVVFAIVGVYGVTGGASVQFTINDKVVSAQEGGQVFLIVGIIVLLVGIALIYVGFKRKIVNAV